MTMQHHYWITKQALSRKFGRKEDECIVSSDAQLDSKLELFRNIQMSCTLIQRIIDKYQEAICYLSQETNSMGRFLKEHSEVDKTKGGEVTLAIGKALIYCAQQQLVLHEPLLRFYEELETFRQRAIGDTLHNVVAMEKSRTEYRAALSWMKNVSQQLDPDANKQLEKFKKVQDQVRRGKTNFDKLALDCIQKIDLLAAARCNMLNYTLSFYHNRFTSLSKKSSKMYSQVSKSFDQEYQARMFREDSIELSANTDKTENKHNVNNNMQLEDKNISVTEKNESLLNEFTIESLSEPSSESLINGSHKEDSINETFSSIWDTLDEISINETKPNEASKNDWILDDDSCFLPSALLEKSLKNISSTSKPETKKKANESSSKTTKSWMNLFEELDPLSNNLMEKSKDSKNSFV